MSNKGIFSSITTTGEISPDMSNREICAYALADWATCIMGNKPPEKFGEGMVKVSQRLGISATPNELSKYADGLIKNK